MKDGERLDSREQTFSKYKLYWPSYHGCSGKNTKKIKIVHRANGHVYKNNVYFVREKMTEIL
jgi:hypothetical protein